MRGPMVGMVFGAWMLAGAAGAAQQIEVDRTLQRVNGIPIMASDVREARVLRLLGDAAASDEAALTALENRLLMLHEVSRAAPADPSREAIVARRKAWASAWPPGTDLPALMARTGTSDQRLDGWFRDDLQIAAYLDQRFGAQADAARAARIADWIAGMRKRANLPGKVTLRAGFRL
jgi:hypothetical protein